MPIQPQLLKTVPTPKMLLLAVAAGVFATVTGDDFELKNQAGNALCTVAYAAGTKNGKTWTTKRHVTAGWHRVKNLDKPDFGQVDYNEKTKKRIDFLVTFTLEDCDPAIIEATKQFEKDKDPNARAPTKQAKITQCTLDCADNTDESVQPFQCTKAYTSGKQLTKIVSNAGGHSGSTPGFDLATGVGHYYFNCNPFNRPSFRKTEEGD